jgi:hypothetical protein
MFFVLIFHSSRWQRRAKRHGYDEQQFQELTERLVPWWIWLPAMLFFIYVGENFVVFAIRVEGKALIENGEFVIKHKGRFVRKLTAEEYDAHRRLEVRGPSGHWMLFSAVPTVYFLLVLPRLRGALATPPTAHG